MRRAWYWLPLPILMVAMVAFLVWTTTSPSGARWTLRTASALLPSLTVTGVDGSWRQGLTIDQLQWRTDSVALTVDTLQLALRRRDLGYGTIRFTRLSAARLSLQLTSAEAPAPGPVELPELALPIAIAAPDLRVDRLTVVQDGTQVELEQIKGGLWWRDDRLRWQALSVQWQEGTLVSTGAVGLQGAWPLAVDASVAYGDSVAAALKASGDLSDLRVDAALTRPYRVAATAHLDLLAEQKPLAVKLDLGESIVADPVTLAAATVTLEGTLDRFAGNLRARLQLPEYGASVLSAGLRWRSPTLAVDAVLQLAENEQGAIALACELTASEPHPLSCKGDFRGVAAPARLGPGAISGPIAIDVAAWQPLALKLAMPALTGQLHGYPVRGKLATELAAQRLDLQELALQIGDNRMTATGSLPLPYRESARQAELIWRIDAPLLEALHPQAAGNLQAQGQVRGLSSQPDVTVAATLREARYGDIRVGRAELDASLSQLAQQASRMELTFARLALGERTIAAGSLSAAGKRADHAVAVSLQDVAALADTELRCAGRAADRPRELRWLCQSWRTQVELPGEASLLALDQPLRASWRDGVFTLQPFCLSGIADQPEAAVPHLCLVDTARWRDGAVSELVMEGTALPVAALLPSATADSPRFTTPPLLDFTLSLQALTPLALTGSAQLSSTVWQWQTSQGTQTATLDPIEVSVRASDRRATIEAATGSAGFGAIRAQVAVVEPRGARQLTGEVRISDVDLNAFGWLAPDLDWSGQLAAAIELGGTLAAPTATGTANLQQGRLMMPPLGQPIEAIEVAAQFDRSEVRFAGSFVMAPGQGQLEGLLALPGGAAETWQLAMRIRGSRLQIQPLPDTVVRFSPELELMAGAKAVQLAGSVDVDQADIRLKTLPADTADVSPDAEWVGAETAAEDPLQLRASVAVDLGNNTHFEGFGADVALRGELRFRHTPERGARLTGEVRVPSGRYRAYGQRLVVRQGTFIFTGPPANPDISLEAIRELPPTVHDQVVGVRVTGPLKNPSGQLFSEPAMPESDMAYFMLTGRAPPPSGAAGQMSATGALLSLGIAGGGDQAQRLAERVGISDFQISTYEAEGGTQAAVSGYLSPRLYVRYGTGLQEGSNSITFQYQLTKRLFIEAISGVEEALDLLYSFTIP